MRKFVEDGNNWYQLSDLPVKSFYCGFCGDKVSSDRGYRNGRGPDGTIDIHGIILICPNCKGPIFFPWSVNQEQIPGPAFGNPIKNLPIELEKLYEEARECTKNLCFTASVLISRKILMNIAVQQGAEEGKTFIQYVSYLSDMGYVPPNGKGWVDHIRIKGNEANHEIKLMSREEAEMLIIFLEMLLKFVYEFHSLIPKSEEVTKT